jgi:hypothetical protein
VEGGTLTLWPSLKTGLKAHDYGGLITAFVSITYELTHTAAAMPLWVAIPIVVALWVSSWISGLDTTGDRAEAYVTWAVTALASVLLVWRLMREI